jgi:hypothetical protein
LRLVVPARIGLGLALRRPPGRLLEESTHAGECSLGACIDVLTIAGESCRQ